MKIYINHLNLDALPELLKTINNYYINSETCTLIYSIDGIYEINNSSSKKLISHDKNIKTIDNYLETFSLIIGFTNVCSSCSGNLPHLVINF